MLTNNLQDIGFAASAFSDSKENEFYATLLFESGEQMKNFRLVASMWLASQGLPNNLICWH